MRLYIFFFALGLILSYLFAPTPTVNAQSGLQHIRRTPNGTVVYKFEDGPNVCYLADNRVERTTSQNSTTLAVALECLPRK